MQLRSESADIIGGGKSQGRQANFTIGAMNAKVFDMLSSSIYSNKIRAIVREYSTNALDGHIAANCPMRPFLVQLPSEYESVFKVRDYGTGLTDDQMFEIFSSYFVSTKTTSNDFAGSFGLGSKVAFSYVDSFQVRSFQNGKMRSYTCYKQNGIPNIEMILETDTTEENGVEISMAVDTKDIARFEREAAFVYSAFDVKPIIDGVPDFEKFYLPMEKTGCAGFYAVNRYNQHHRHTHDFGGDIVVKMGPVFYALNGDCRQILLENDVIRILREDVNTLVLEVDIGDLDIPPSRELIDNTDHNIEMMKNILVLKTKPFLDELVNKYCAIKDLPMEEARAKVNDYPVSIRNYIRNRKDFVFSTFFGVSCNISSFDDEYDTHRKKVRNKFSIMNDAKNNEEIVVKDSAGNDVTIKCNFKPFLRKYDGNGRSGRVKKNFVELSSYYVSMNLSSGCSNKGITIYTITDKTTARIQENYSLLKKCTSGQNIWLCDPTNEEEMFVVELLKELFCGDVHLVPLDNTNAPLPKVPTVSSSAYARGEKPHVLKKLDAFYTEYGSVSISINELKEKDTPFVWIEANMSYNNWLLTNISHYASGVLLAKIRTVLAEKFELDNGFYVMVLPEALQKHAKNNQYAIHVKELFDTIMREFLQFPVYYEKDCFDVTATNSILRLPEINKQTVFTKIHKVVDFDISNFFHNERMSEILEEIVSNNRIEKHLVNLAEMRYDEIKGTITEQTRRIEQILAKYPMLKYVANNFDNSVVSEYIQKVDYVNTIRGENA